MPQTHKCMGGITKAGVVALDGVRWEIEDWPAAMAPLHRPNASER